MLTHFLDQRGVTVPMVILLAIIISSSVFIVYKSLPIGEPQPTVDKGFMGNAGSLTLVPSPSPSVSPSIQKVSILSQKPSSTPSVKPTTTPPATTTTQSSSSPESTPTPLASAQTTPIPDVYRLDPVNSSEIRLPANAPYGHGATVLLKDSTGKIVSDQKDFHYIWTIDDDSFLYVKEGIGEKYGSCTGSEEIKSPCPNNFYIINPAGKTGKTTLRVKAQYKPTGKIVAETQFSVEAY